MNRYYYSFLCLILTIFSLALGSSGFAQERGKNDYATGRDQSNKRSGENDFIHLQRSRVFIQQFDIENAIFELDNAVAQNPYQADAYLQRSLLKFRLGMTTEAKRDLDRALKLNPYVADLYGFNGKDNQLQLLDFEPVESSEELSFEDRLSHYWEIFGNQYELKDGTTGQNLESIAEILEYMEKGDWNYALERVDELLIKYPDASAVHDLSGLILKELGDLEGAEKAFRKAIRHQPDFAVAWYNLSQVKLLQGDRQLARDYLDQAVDLQQDLAKAYYDRALLKKQSGDPEGAIEDYNKVLSIDSDLYSQAYLNRGLTRKILGDYSGALNDINRILEKEPNNPEYLKNRGNIYLLFGELNLAITDYTKAIEQGEDLGGLYYNRGIAHILNFDMVSACHDLEQAVNLGYEAAEEKRKYFCTY